MSKSYDDLPPFKKEEEKAQESKLKTSQSAPTLDRYEWERTVSQLLTDASDNDATNINSYEKAVEIILDEDVTLKKPFSKAALDKILGELLKILPKLDIRENSQDLISCITLITDIYYKKPFISNISSKLFTGSKFKDLGKKIKFFPELLEKYNDLDKDNQKKLNSVVDKFAKHILTTIDEVLCKSNKLGLSSEKEAEVETKLNDEKVMHSYILLVHYYNLSKDLNFIADSDQLTKLYEKIILLNDSIDTLMKETKMVDPEIKKGLPIIMFDINSKLAYKNLDSMYGRLQKKYYAECYDSFKEFEANLIKLNQYQKLIPQLSDKQSIEWQDLQEQLKIFSDNHLEKIQQRMKASR